MGREVVFANIRKRMIAMIVGGVILTLMGGFISFAAVVAGEYSVLILGLFALTPAVKERHIQSQSRSFTAG